MTVTQTVDIPADHRLIIDVPREIPAGKAVLTFTSAAKSPQFKLSKKELDEIMKTAHTPASDSLSGILAHLGDITVEQIREERLAKYLP